MKKQLKRIFGFLVLAFAIAPMMNVNAAGETRHVTTGVEFIEAVEDANVTTIIIDDNIETTVKANVTSEKVIDGQGHTITYVGTFRDGGTDNTVWGSNAPAPYNGGVYIIQFYRTTATLKNIKLKGGNVGLSSNGSTVTLEGTIDVSENGFGGIEMTRKVGNTEDPETVPYPNIDATNATIINTTETSAKPTLWFDLITIDEIADGKVEFVSQDGVFEGAAYFNDNGQLKFYNKEANLPTAVDGEVIVIPKDELYPTPEEPTPTPTPTPEPDTTVEENPNTYDGILVYFAVAAMGLVAIVFSSRKVYNKVK